VLSIFSDAGLSARSQGRSEFFESDDSNRCDESGTRIFATLLPNVTIWAMKSPLYGGLRAVAISTNGLGRPGENYSWLWETSNPNCFRRAPSGR
jgi:hypothetical protein